MDVVTGAMGTLLHKLDDLLAEDYQLQASVRDDVAFLRAELESMEAALLRISEAPVDRPPDAQDRLWARGGAAQDDLSGLEYPGVLYSNSPRASSKRPGLQTPLIKENWEGRQPKTRDKYLSPEKNKSLHPRSKVGRSSTDLMNVDSEVELKNESVSRSVFQKLQEYGFDDKWLPLVDYLCTFGLKESHFTYIYERHMACFQISQASAEERLDFLLNAGVKSKDMKRILVRQPQILEYTLSNLKSHVDFLVSIGVPSTRIGQIISSAPSMLSYSVEQSLKPTVRYLIEEVGIEESDVGKVVQLSPQILVQKIDSAWKSRSLFLSKELGAPKDSIVKMVTKHPQLLHYSIEDGILPRINFLRSIGMRNSDILKVLTSLTQVLSLSLEDNLKPKYLYLINDLKNEVKSLTKYPMYLSLSLDQRIRPRHRFLVSLKKAPKGPFPLSSFVPTDERFCQRWAGTSLEKYHTFRQRLLLTGFAEKSGRKTLVSRR
ncbi:Transcription termination factor MTERF9, chloroplastic [Dichanthelium oligosanthes]|uniref:Transcription termination factor MTERF9, chloroplastic n=1 Tax=Dichanthelium oligosanthes TaxID=888268 RepID=A0A1E5VF15_9POAL|nr:Transcription termination factor MTERF9, chloroplastic [Dichanthelium oligosanthes]